MSIFRVRNLLVHVLPIECEVIDSGGGDTGGDCGDIDASIICDDSGGCGDTCGDTEGCGDSCADPSDCGDTGGCGDTCGITTGCGNDITQGCPNPDTGCADTSGCTAFECSLHFDTICDTGVSKCDIGLSNRCEFAGVTGLCPGNVTLECPGGGNSECHILNSLPTCIAGAVSGCGVTLIAQTPVALCFQSNEPKLNPNSLADLGVLRRQLTAGLRIVQRREQALAKALSPRTLQQISTAESHLNNALRELQTQKQFIQARVAAGKKSATPKRAVKKTAKKVAAKKTAAKRGGHAKR
jgi:hypothetical protein